MSGKAVGLIEVFGLACAFYAADAACKAGDVEIIAFDKNKPANADELPVPLLVMIKVRGNVSDVNMAIEAAASAAREITGINIKHIMSGPDEDMERFLQLSCL